MKRRPNHVPIRKRKKWNARKGQSSKDSNSLTSSLTSTRELSSESTLDNKWNSTSNIIDGSCMSEGEATHVEPVPAPKTEVSSALLLQVKEKVDLFLSHRWISIVHRDSVHVVLISAQDNVSIQRSIRFSHDGSVQLFVHCQNVDVTPYLDKENHPETLDENSVNSFVDRAVQIVNKVKLMEVCSGYDEERFKGVWSVCPFGEIDKNPYQECRYIETFRSSSCRRLVNGKKWRCQECQKLYWPLKRRADTAAVEEAHPATRNTYLTEEQRLKKLEKQAKIIEADRKKITRMQEKMQELIEKQGVQIDNDLSSDLTSILHDSKMTPAQSVFFHQQVKASQKRNMVGMRWHPTMIRLALSLHITSPAAYEMLRDTGMVKLPSSRTLFDYNRVKPVVEGIDTTVLDSLGERMKNFESKEERYKKYHVLMADEMYISQNLIFQKSSGKMIGYTSLDDFDREVKELEHYLQNHQEEVQQTIASKVMVFMVKGVSSGVKEVVATYGVGNLSSNQMYVWTWQVIGALERAGVAVVALVTDGCSINRAFIKMHKPVTKVPSGVIFDTINKAAPHRRLFFLSDVPHLLKTIRNNILNSRSDKKKSRRCLTFKGKRISWDFIIKLYSLRKSKVLKKSYKLNAMNVFPDSYARMKVKYAAEALSRTVAQDLSDQEWSSRASQTIDFVRLVNDWFDCLNGAHSAMGKRKRNPNLDPYERPDDLRLQTHLQGFLDYLEEWKQDAYNPTSNMNSTAATDVMVDDPENAVDETIDAEEQGLENDEAEAPASKRILSAQTLEGIEMSTKAFMEMVPFLLREGTKFVNARVFTQDPLEQHFSKLRAGQGGSTNPNLNQVLNRNRSLHLIGQLGMKRRKGNTEEGTSAVQVTTEPLPKRKCERSVKFHD